MFILMLFLKGLLLIIPYYIIFIFLERISKVL
jgi:hypothetical protein